MNRGYATSTGYMNYSMILGIQASFDHSFNGPKYYVFYDMCGLANLFPNNPNKDSVMYGCYLTGGANGFFFYYAGYSFETGADGGNNPGQYFYFMEYVVGGGNAVTNIFAKFNTNDLITNCNYGGGILNISSTDATYIFNLATRSGNSTNSTRQQGSLATVISVGLNTTTGNLIQY